MAEKQPPTVVEGATTADVDDEVPVAAKSAEDRKAAAALSSLDTPRDDHHLEKDVDVEAVRKAMERLGGVKAVNGTAVKHDEKKVVKKNLKVDPADVALLVCLSVPRTHQNFIVAIFGTLVATRAMIGLPRERGGFHPATPLSPWSSPYPAIALFRALAPSLL